MTSYIYFANLIDNNDLNVNPLNEVKNVGLASAYSSSHWKQEGNFPSPQYQEKQGQYLDNIKNMQNRYFCLEH